MSTHLALVQLLNMDPRALTQVLSKNGTHWAISVDARCFNLDAVELTLMSVEADTFSPSAREGD